MPGLRLLTFATLIALLSACSSTLPTRPSAKTTPTQDEVTEPSAAPDASASPETGAPTTSTDGESAGRPAAKVLYTQAEYARMSNCVELADIALHSSIRKRGGASLDAAKRIYRTQPDPEMRMAIVDKVYSDDVRNAWDYTVRHFQRCAVGTAQVPQERLQMASYCMQRQMIGDLSYSFKANERPISDAYAYFANFKSPVVKQIIDAVYATDASKEEVKSQLWTGCMAPVTR